MFETGGQAYAFETLEEADDSLEALDLNEGHYIGAFSDQGEVITMSPGDLWITFTSSGTFDKTAPADGFARPKRQLQRLGGPTKSQSFVRSESRRSRRLGFLSLTRPAPTEP